MEAAVESAPVSDDEEFAPKRIPNYRSIIDSDSEDDVPPQNISIAAKSHDESDENKEQPTLNSSEDEQPALNSSEDEQPARVVNKRKNANPKKNFLPVKSQRKSANKAKEIIKEKMSHKQQEELKIKIQSEKQRMEREQEIRVPYHKPKQMSLKEFLSRRTVHKPSLDKIRKGEIEMSPALEIKMLSKGEGLVKFAQEMKEREEEAVEFFKSESESDDEDCDQTENKENVSENVQPDLIQQEIVKEPEMEVATVESEIPIAERVVGEVKSDDHEIVEPAMEQADLATAEQEEISKEESVEPSELQRLTEKYENMEPLELPAQISPPPPQKPSESKEALVARLAEKYKNFKMPSIKTPTLKTLDEMGAKDSRIDLGTGLIETRKLSGPEMLFQRYLKNVQKPKPKDKVCMNILTVENGRLENQQVEVKLTKETEVDHNRPGLARAMLQGSLLSQINQKSHEELMKRIEAEKDLEHELEPDDKEDACDGDFDDEAGEEEESSEGESEPEPEPEIVETKKKKSAGCGFLDEEAIDEDEPEDEEEESESESSSSSESDQEEPLAEGTAPKKGRILKAFVDSDDEDKPADPVEVENEKQAVSHEAESEQPILPAEAEKLGIAASQETIASAKSFGDDPFALTQEETPKSSDQFASQATDFTFTEPSVSEKMNKGGAGDLWDSGPSQMEDEDFMEILSGRFTTTQGVTGNEGQDSEEKAAENSSEDNFGDSQFVPQVANQPEVTGNAFVAESENFDSENFDSQVPEKVAEDPAPKTITPPRNTRKLLDSSDDEVDASTAKQKRKKLRKKRKHKVVKLGFSDDESDVESDQPEDLEESGSENLDECEEEEEEQVDVLVDYDSEENEVEVRMNKKDRIKAAGAYLEKEAELSESEWGSADENEDNLDKFEGELGDEDEFDQDKLQEEVGRIHARKVLDDDIRNVKKIEELLFEDEENDGVGRERKFRWKNQKEGFAPADENAMDGDLLDENDDADFESEIAWRKMRHERETLLSEHASKFTESDTMADEITMFDPESQTVTSQSTSAFITKKFRIIKSSSALECPSTSEVKKESPFLIKQVNFKKFRNSSFLSRDEQTLNKIARMVSHKDDEVQTFSHGSNSMSFLTIDKPDESKKRKSVVTPKEAADSVKRRKVDTTNSKKLLLDQLD